MKLEFKSDFFEIVNFIKARDTLTHEFETIIDNIRHIFATRLLTAIRHDFRKANNCANTLVEMCVHGTTRLSLWKVSPPKLSIILLTDFTSMLFVKH